jgi:UDP-N-acetylglucosamine acyltransferase
MTIHPSAIIYDGAVVHDEANIGPLAVIGANVRIGSGTTVGPHAVIDGYTEIGCDCKIFAGASIGLDPQDFGYKGEPTGVKIGDRVTVREYATIHRATKEGFTTIGDDCFLMNYVHIAHNCQIGKGVIMANGATLAGYVNVGDGAVMSGYVILHQHLRVGRLCMLSGMTGSRLDLPPFTTLDGRPAQVRGINVLGLRRNKLSAEIRSAIKEAYRVLYRSGLNHTNALLKIESDIEPFSEIKEIVSFYRDSKRGVAGGYDPNQETTETSDGGVMSEAGAAI